MLRKEGHEPFFETEAPILQIGQNFKVKRNHTDLEAEHYSSLSLLMRLTEMCVMISITGVALTAGGLMSSSSDLSSWG